MNNVADILIINFGSSKTPAIQEMLGRLAVSSEITGWDSIEKKDLQKCNGIILSGAPVLLTKTDTAPYLTKFSFLKTTSQPVLGICFGHQLLGMLYGAKVFLGEEIRKHEAIAICDKNSLFKGFEENAFFTQDHTEGIELPVDFTLLASSAQYPVEAMKHKRKPLFGVQFHPEGSGENGEKLMRNFSRIVVGC